MSKILIVAEHLNGALFSSSARCVCCALAFGGVFLVLVLVVANAANAHPIAQVLAPQVAKAAAGYTHVLGPSTTFGKDLMPCVAALLGVAQVSDIMAVDGAHTFRRPIYAGNAIVTVEAPAAQTVVGTVRTV